VGRGGVEVFLEDCDNFKDYFQTVFDMYCKEILTKEKALELLKTEYAFEQGNEKENYQKMYPDKRHLDYKFDEFVDFLKKCFSKENFDPLTFKFEWDHWEGNFFHRCLKNETDQTNSTNIEEILHKKISEEMMNVWKLLYLNSDKNQTIPAMIRSCSNTSLSQDKQQHIEETVQTPEQAQQEKEKIYALLIKVQLINRMEIKGKPEYRFTETATTSKIYNSIERKVKAGLLKMDHEDICNFIKTLKDKNGYPTNDAVNTFRSRYRKSKKQADSNKL
jgi:hypothetical protein